MLAEVGTDLPHVLEKTSPLDDLQDPECEAALQRAAAEASVPDEDVTRGVVAYPLRGGNPKRVCYSLCIVRWTLDGKFLNIALPGGSHSTTVFRTIVVPLRPGEDFPPLPPKGIKSPQDLAGFPGAKLMDDLIRPGPTGSIYAVDRKTVHRNIYRIPLP